MAAAMAVTTHKQVDSGFFRNHLYVLLGLATAACAAASLFDRRCAWLAGFTAAVAYVGAIAWLYQAKKLGKACLGIVGVLSLTLDMVVHSSESATSKPGLFVHVIDAATSSAVLGTTMVAMLLGHWYLNAPQMDLAPLRRLLMLAQVSVACRVAVCVAAPMTTTTFTWPDEQVFWWLLTLRYVLGLAAVPVLLWMAWQTLKIPNTQSATGILYIAVFAVLTGELASRLLSQQHAFIL